MRSKSLIINENPSRHSFSSNGLAKFKSWLLSASDAKSRLKMTLLQAYKFPGAKEKVRWKGKLWRNRNLRYPSMNCKIWTLYGSQFEKHLKTLKRQSRKFEH